MQPINNMDEAELKYEFRRMYREQGKEAMIRVLYEMSVGTKLLAEVIKEEWMKELDEEKG